MLAKSLGADRTVDAGSEDVVSAIATWTSGDGPTAVFEATGAPAVMRQAVDVVAPTGTIVAVGVSVDEVQIPLIEFTRKELTILGSRNSMGEFGAAVELVQTHQDDVLQLISHRFPFEAAADAFRQAADSPADTAKIVIQVGGDL